MKQLRIILLVILCVVTVQINHFISDKGGLWWIYHHITPKKQLENIASNIKESLSAIPSDLMQKIPETGTVILVDFRQPSYKKRLWVVQNKQIKINCRVAHGKNSGETFTTSFSNKPESNKSCIGYFKTGNVYWGSKGLAMRIYGMEPGINDNAYDRGIVFHGSDYVTSSFLLRNGRIGRSLGCFATSYQDNSKIISLCKYGAKLYAVGTEA